jgi:hypothetical protein
LTLSAALRLTAKLDGNGLLICGSLRKEAMLDKKLEVDYI